MTETSSVDPPKPAGTPLSHLAARCSIIAALLCFTGNCLANRAKPHLGADEGEWFGQLMSYMTLGIVIGGVVLGFWGLVDGIRRRSSDTIGVAIIGLVLNLGIIALMVWALRVLREAGLT